MVPCAIQEDLVVACLNVFSFFEIQLIYNVVIISGTVK